jgi:hypothetical protein
MQAVMMFGIATQSSCELRPRFLQVPVR